jgi:hypothetical protein
MRDGGGAELDGANKFPPSFNATSFTRRAANLSIIIWIALSALSGVTWTGKLAPAGGFSADGGSSVFR